LYRELKKSDDHVSGILKKKREKKQISLGFSKKTCFFGKVQFSLVFSKKSVFFLNLFLFEQLQGHDWSLK